MSSKFKIEIDDEETEDRQDVIVRPGPMASAIEETGTALRSDADAMAEAKAIQTRYAKAFKDLVETEQSVEMVPISKIDTGHFTRDRRVIDSAAQSELAQSILEIGLSNPIRVERTETGYRLVQGTRRLKAFEFLLSETGQERFATIPASIWNESDLALGYRRMVDENLVREDVSYAELAMLAQSFAEDKRTPAQTASTAVDALYASVSAAKRSHIRAFLEMLERADGMLMFPEAISRNNGLKLVKLLDDDVRRSALQSELAAKPGRDSEEEQAIIGQALEGREPGKRGPSARRASSVRHSFKALGKTIKVTRTADRMVIAGVDLSRADVKVIENFVKSVLKTDS